MRIVSLPLIMTLTLCLQAMDREIERLREEGCFDMHCARVQRLITYVRSSGEVGAISLPDHRGFSPLEVAVCVGNEPVVREIVQLGGDIHARDAMGTTLLGIAAGHGREEIGRFFIGLGLGVNAQNNEGETPIMFAAQQGKPRMIEFLLGQGADAGIRDIHGHTAMHRALARGHFVSVGCLCGLSSTACSLVLGTSSLALAYALYCIGHSL